MTETVTHGYTPLDPFVLGLFSVVLTGLTCISFGLSVPAGVFVPLVLSGAAFGRMVGEIVRSMATVEIHAGMYALIGGASMLGGVTRIIVCVTVILIEATGHVQVRLSFVIRQSCV